MKGSPLLGVRVELIRYTGDAARLIAISSKVSLSKKPVEDLLNISDDEVMVWIKETFRRQHFSPWEHASYTFLVDGLSRVASHQLVRHRHASYTQMSHRYTEGYLRRLAFEASKIAGLNCPEKHSGDEDERSMFECYSKALDVVLEHPDNVDIAAIAFVPPVTSKRALTRWAHAVLGTASAYYKMLAAGVRMEDARYVLADSVRTRIVVTMNARELVQVFLPLRTCKRAQWEIRYIAWRIWEELVEVHPALFKWAGPSCILKENTSRKEPVELEKFLDGREGFTIERCPELVERKAIPACLKASRAPLPFEL